MVLSRHIPVRAVRWSCSLLVRDLLSSELLHQQGSHGETWQSRCPAGAALRLALRGFPRCKRAEGDLMSCGGGAETAGDPPATARRDYKVLFEKARSQLISYRPFIWPCQTKACLPYAVIQNFTPGKSIFFYIPFPNFYLVHF